MKLYYGLTNKEKEISVKYRNKQLLIDRLDQILKTIKFETTTREEIQKKLKINNIIIPEKISEERFITMIKRIANDIATIGDSWRSVI